MSTFTTLSTSSIIKNPKTGESVKIYKVQKDGTKRIFFKPVAVVNGEELRLTSTLWATLWEAEKLSKKYLNRNN